ncbi:Gfo/Idh/MocA family protein [Mycolicibacterium austroafricanum]|uniref:Gfo/Idh/MocA family protein n=1 Tax=Mycolicibacterium austroafricanum TaxID=39687 RepID=UPI000A042AA3|nr:Gfo/Idh/MocA family oxidoreductase [Mycolicibacterium austroafricanum]QZY47752.1 Gfo/Idh/MocA family oxidoreductase [Mycolicibacterium austroafricanum]
MVNVGIIGLGKMGLSQFSIINAHHDVKVVGVCDSSSYILDILGKYTGVDTYTDLEKMLQSTNMDAAVISTPSKFHAPMVRDCLERGIHVFCEKPFCLDPADSAALADLARRKSLVTQVGYHNRHVGAFAEVKRLLDLGVLGRVTHVLGEAYGPVVLKPKGSTWRSKKDEGGGALYDYAAHPADLMTWYFGRPMSVSGTVLGQVFSSETEDEVFTTVRWPSGVSGQLSVSWSDESHRKMTTRVSIWGTNGKIFADRQEVQVYLRDDALAPNGYGKGWTVRYTTELTNDVDFYVRGEEYSAQLDTWLKRVSEHAVSGSSDFTEACITDELLYAILHSVDGSVRTLGSQSDDRDRPPEKIPRVLSWFRHRRRAGGTRVGRNR